MEFFYSPLRLATGWHGLLVESVVTRPPRRTCAGYIVVQTIAVHGPLTIEQGMVLHKTLGQYQSITRRIYERAVRSGWLEKRGEKYALTKWITEWYAEQATNAPITNNVVGPPYFNAWTPPMDGRKYVAWMRSGFDRRRKESSDE